MQLMNWSLDKILVHEIFLREGKDIITPLYGTTLTKLDRQAQEIFLQRIESAISNDSKCMEMHITKTDPGSFFAFAKELLENPTDDDFIIISCKIADLLTRAQASRAIPGGLLMIFTGTVGLSNDKYIGVLKAESQDGFIKKNNNGTISLELLRELFLTPSAKMYKIGLMIESKSTSVQNISAYVYDYLMTKINRDAAATYFYETFLGCSFPQNSATETKKFMMLTKKFIFGCTHLDESQKYMLYADLQSYLRSSDQTIQTVTFAERHINSPELKDDYANYMRDNHFPTIAVPKDTKEIIQQLRQRKITFKSEIKISGPSEKMDELVTFENIEGPATPDGSKPEWTKIIIKDALRKME